MAINRTIDFLPEYLRTIANQRFLNSTLDRVISDPTLRKFDGFVGRRYADGKQLEGNYINEPSGVREKYQLEPEFVFSDNGVKTRSAGFIDLLNSVAVRNGRVDLWNRLLTGNSYSFKGFVDLDKLTNYYNYVWIPEPRVVNTGVENVLVDENPWFRIPIEVSNSNVPSSRSFNVKRTSLGFEVDGYDGINPTIHLRRSTASTTCSYTFNISANVANANTRIPKVITQANPSQSVVISNAQQRFTTTTGRFQNSAGLSVNSDEDFNFKWLPFTVETWVYVSSVGDSQDHVIAGQWDNTDTSNSSWALIRTNNGVDNTVKFVWTDLDTGLVNSLLYTDTGGLSLNAWHHVAVSRVSNTVRLYVDGNIVNSSTIGTISRSDKPFTVGVNAALNQGFNGYLEDLRVTKNIALYTINEYDVPQSNLNNDANTVLLITFDGANGDTVFSDSTELENSRIWIQSQIGRDGTIVSNPNLDARDILGVSNNGVTNGAIQFEVPSLDDESYYRNLQLTGNEFYDKVDLATTLNFNQIHNAIYDLFVQSPIPGENNDDTGRRGGIDGVRSLNGKTLIFVNKQVSGWEKVVPLEFQGIEDNLYEQTTPVPNSERFGVWQIRVVTKTYEDGSTLDVIQLELIREVEKDYRIDVLDGLTYRNTTWYKRADVYNPAGTSDALKGFFLRMPQLSGNYTTLYLQDDQSDFNVLPLIIINSDVPTLDVESEILCKPYYVSGNGVEFINGLHIKFGLDSTPSQYTDLKIVDRVFTGEEILDSETATEEITFSLTSVTKIVSGDLLLIDDEYMQVTDVDLTLSKVTVVRPQRNSVTAPHSNGSFVQVLRTPSYIVEGVGQEIVLVPYQDLTPSEQYLDFAQDPDYITINRASLDRNPWSRTNRWFNKQVVTKSLEYLTDQGYEFDAPGANLNAVRPIVEFVAGLRLYDFGSVSLATINFFDDNKINDALSKINGRNITDTQAISIDGTTALKQYDLVIFNADTDPAVRQKIYQVDYVDVDGDYNLFNKTDVKAATTADINLNSPGAVDGVTLTVNDRVLVWKQVDASENGIYSYNGSGLQRATDTSRASDFARGFYVKVTSGSTYSNNWFRYKVTTVDRLIQYPLDQTADGSTVLKFTNIEGIEVDMRVDFAGYTTESTVSSIDTLLNEVTVSSAITAPAGTTVNFCNIYLDQVSDPSTIVFDAVTDRGPRVYLKEYATASDGNCVSVAQGEQNRGTNWCWDNQSRSWIKSSQIKDQIQQKPLFDVFDFNDVSFSNQTVYNSTNFAGSTLFEYKINSTAASDPVLKFGITYRTINNVGDISFLNTFEIDRFNYIDDVELGTSQDTPINTGTAKIVDPCTGQITQYDVWQRVLNNLELYQNIEITGSNLKLNSNINAQLVMGDVRRDINVVLESVNDIQVGMVVSGVGVSGLPRVTAVDTVNKTITLSSLQNILDQTELTFNNVLQYDIPGKLLVKNTPNAYKDKIFVDGTQLYSDLFTVQQMGDIIRISISVDALDPMNIHYQNISAESKLLIKLIANTVLPNAWFDVPTQFEINPYNFRSNEFTLSDLKSHTDALHSNHGHRITPLVTDNSLGNIEHRANPGLIMLHEGFSVLPTLLLTDTRFDIERAIATAGREYEQFKLQFIEASNQVEAIETLTAAAAVDSIFTLLTQNKSADQAWYTSDMVPFNGNDITYIVDDTAQTAYDISDVFENQANNKAVLVYLNGLQLVRGTDYEFDTVSPTVNISRTLRVNDELRIAEFVNTDGSFVPVTPAKLGLGPVYIPEIYIDDTYRTPTRVLQGHDGSITTAFNDYRDQLILELELRIFNNIKLDTDLWNNVIQSRVQPAGKFRELNGTALYSMIEEASISRKYFYDWVANNRVNYANSVYDETDPFTFNYSDSRDRITNQKCLGYWRGIYRDFYDTDRPHTHPWEMLGITKKPSWWESIYGPAPYTGTNLVLWEDLKNGVSTGGNIRSVLGARTTSIVNYENNTTYNLLDAVPADSGGTLLHPIDAYLIGGLITSSAKNPFTFNDNGPAETAWRRSSSYAYAKLNQKILQNPQFMLGTLWDLDNYKPYALIDSVGVFSASYVGFRYLETQFPSINDLKIHTVDTDDAGVPVRCHSILNFVVENLKSQGQNPVILKNAIVNSDVNLVYKLAAFADVDNIQVYAEQNSVQTQGNTVKVPQEDYELLLSESVPIDVASYSGVIISRSANGYKVTGYDRQYPYFIIYPSDVNTTPKQFQVGSQTYGYYTEFLDNPLYIPYDYEFISKQTVVDFLLSYGEHLKRQGFAFESQPEQDRINWLDAAVQFIKWSGYNWSSNNTSGQRLSLVLNPAAGVLKYTPVAGTLQNLMLPDNLLLDENQNIISSRDIDVYRDQDVTYVNNLQPNSTISALRTNIVSYEHKLIVKNQTVFGDLIFNPALGIRQNRLRLVGLKTNDWDGTINSAGYLLMFSSVPEWQPNTDYLQGDVIKYKNRNYTALEPVIGATNFQTEKFSISDVTYQNRLLPSIGAKSLDLERAYDINHKPSISDFTRLRSNALGYVERTWLVNLGLDLNNQTEFYRGWIKEKGSFNAVDKFTAAGQQDLLADFTVSEEYAVKLGDYGATGRTGFVEVSLINDTESNNPVAVEFADGPNSTDLIRVSTTELYKKSSNWTTNFISNTGQLVKNEDRFIDAGPVLPAEIYNKAKSVTVEYSAEQENALTFNSLESLTKTEDVQNLLKNVRYGNWIWIAVDETLTTDNKYNVITWKNSDAKIRQIRKNNSLNTLELYLDQALDIETDQIVVIDINDLSLTVQGAFKVVKNQVNPTADYVSVLSVTSDIVELYNFDTVTYAADLEPKSVYIYETLRYNDIGSASLNRNLDKLYLPKDGKLYVDYNNLGWAVFDFREPYDSGSSNLPDSENQITGAPEGLITTSIAQDDIARWLWLGKVDDNKVVVKSFRNTNLGLGVTGDLDTSLATFDPTTSANGERSDTLKLGTEIINLTNGKAAATGTDSSNRGQVYILQASNDGYQVNQIFRGSASGAYYGSSIAASDNGEWLFVGETIPSGAGNVYAYRKFNSSNSSSSWTTVGNASSSYTMSFTPDNLYSIRVKVADRLRIPVAEYTLSGNMITFSTSVNASNISVTQLSEYYQLMQTIADPDAATGGKFGSSVTANSDASTLVVSAPFNGVGKIYVFSHDVEKTFVSTTTATINLGSTVTSVEKVVVKKNGVTQTTGTNYVPVVSGDTTLVFHGNSQPTSGTVIEVDMMQYDLAQTITGETTDTEYGHSVAINGNWLSVGVPKVTNQVGSVTISNHGRMELRSLNSEISNTITIDQDDLRPLPNNEYVRVNNWLVSAGTSGAISSVSISGTAGELSVSSGNYYQGQAIVVSGTLTGTGSITGYTNPKTYYIAAVNSGVSIVITDTYANAISGVSSLTTTSGTTTGLTFTLQACVDNLVTNVNNLSDFTGVTAVKNLFDTVTFTIDSTKHNTGIVTLDNVAVLRNVNSTYGLVQNINNFDIKSNRLGSTVKWITDGVLGVVENYTEFLESTQTTFDNAFNIVTTVGLAFENSLVLTLNSVFGIRTGYQMIGDGVTGSPVVIGVDAGSNTISVNITQQGLGAGTVLTFVDPGRTDTAASSKFDSGTTLFYDREAQNTQRLLLYQLLRTGRNALGADVDTAQLTRVKTIQYDKTSTPNIFFTGSLYRLWVGDGLSNDEYNNVFVYTNNNLLKGWTLNRQQQELLEPRSIFRAWIYDSRTQEKAVDLDVVDIANGLLPGAIAQHIDYISVVDPASYGIPVWRSGYTYEVGSRVIYNSVVYTANELNNTLFFNSDQWTANTAQVSNTGSKYWGAAQVGETWFVTSKLRSVLYEQGELADRISNYNRWFSDTEIVVREWTASAVPPAEYSNTDGFVDPNSAYVFNPVNNTYYFWVTNKNTVGNKHTISAADISLGLVDIQGTGLPMISPATNNSVILYNVKNFVDSAEYILHIDYVIADHNNRLHSEYQLLTEDNSLGWLNTPIYYKMVDSLSGIDQNSQEVPDNNLNAEDRYGVLLRPRQTMFRDREKALKIYFETINSNLRTVIISNMNTLDNLKLQQDYPAVTEYQFRVPDRETLLILNTNDYAENTQVLVEKDRTALFDGWNLVKLVNSEWEVVNSQFYNLNGYWKYVDWQSPEYQNKPADYTINHVGYLNSIVPVAGETVEILDNGDRKRAVYLVEADSSFTPLFMQDGTIEFLDIIYTLTGSDETGFDSTIGFDNDQAQVIRLVLDALNNHVLVDRLCFVADRAFFAVLRYAIQENRNLDWLFQTSFINVKHRVKNLNRQTNFRSDDEQFVRDFIEENKPFHSRLRDYINSYDLLDQAQVAVSDFDLPALYDEVWYKAQFAGSGGRLKANQAGYFLEGYTGLNLVDNILYISGSGLANHAMGTWPNTSKLSAQAQNWVFALNQYPLQRATKYPVNPDSEIGIAINGVPFYSIVGRFKDRLVNANDLSEEEIYTENIAETNGYAGPDAGNGYLTDNDAYVYRMDPVLLYTKNSAQHSPILGFALDGYPIYGPYGYANSNGTGGIIRNTSSYTLKSELRLVQESIQNGTKYASLGSPTGVYTEDWQYVPGAGTLDQHNGRFVITPEYPYGTYAYFVTVDENNNPVYPYIIGPTFAGVPTGLRIEYQGQSSVPVYDNGRYTMPSSQDLAVNDWSLRSPSGSFYNDYKRFLQSPYRNWFDNYTYNLVRLDLADAGKGYTSEPTIVISGGGGSGATASAAITSSGQIKDSDFIINIGTGYTGMPTITLVGGQNVPAWSNTVTYSSGTVVSYTPAGASTFYYESLSGVPAGTSLSNTLYWVELPPNNSKVPRSGVLVPVLENNLIRSFDISMKFDRVKGRVETHTLDKLYLAGDIVRHQINQKFYITDSNLVSASANQDLYNAVNWNILNSYNTNDVVENSENGLLYKATTSVVPGIAITNTSYWVRLTYWRAMSETEIVESDAATRITAFYTPANNMVTSDLKQLLSGADFAGTLVDGYEFTQTHPVPTGALADTDDQEIDNVSLMAQFDAAHYFGTVFTNKHRIQGTRSGSFGASNIISVGDEDNNIVYTIPSDTNPLFTAAVARYIKVNTNTGAGNSPDLAELACGTQDFTFEFFFRIQTLDQTQTLVDNFNSTPDNGFRIYVSNTNELRCDYYNASTTLRQQLNAGETLRDIWYHVALERKANTMSLYLDGSLRDSYSESTVSSLNFTSTDVSFGANTDDSDLANVYMDEVRLTRGLLRYDAETYTIPSGGFGRNTDQDVYYNNNVLLYGFESLINEVEDVEIRFAVQGNRKAFADLGVNQKVLTLLTENFATVENQTIATVPYTVIKTLDGDVENSYVLTLDSVYDIFVGMTVSGYQIAGCPKVVEIDTDAKTVRLDVKQTVIDNGTSLTFIPVTGKSDVPAITMVAPSMVGEYNIIDAGVHADYSLGVEDFTLEFWYNDPVHQLVRDETANSTIYLSSVAGVVSGMKMFTTTGNVGINVNSVNTELNTVTLASTITGSLGDQLRFVKTNAAKTVFVLSDFVTANVTANVSASTLVDVTSTVSLKTGMYVNGTQIVGSATEAVTIADINSNGTTITLNQAQTLTVPAELKFNRSKFSLTGVVETNTSGEHRVVFYVTDATGVKQTLLSEYQGYSATPIYVALDRYDSKFKLFINGSLTQTAYAPWDFGDGITPLPLLLSNTTDPFSGKLADFRITKGVSRYGLSTPVDTAISSDFADQYLGIRSADITVDGTGFVNNITSGSTEEHIPGRLYDTLNIRVFAKNPATPTANVGIGYRMFQDMLQNVYYYAIPASGTTSLASNLTAYDDTVYLVSVVGFPDTDPDTNNRGVFFVAGERISYLHIDRTANTVSGLLRGTLGTHVPLMHSSGTRVEVAGVAEQFPGSAGSYGVIGTVSSLVTSSNTVSLATVNNVSVGMAVQNSLIRTKATETSTIGSVSVENASGILAGMSVAGVSTGIPKVVSVVGNLVTFDAVHTVFNDTLLTFFVTVDSVDTVNNTVTLSSLQSFNANEQIILGEIVADAAKPFGKVVTNTLTNHRNTWYTPGTATAANGAGLAASSTEVAQFLLNNPALLNSLP
jgi:hypothetical protein